MLRFPFIESKRLLEELRHYEDYFKRELQKDKPASPSASNINNLIDRYFREMRGIDFSHTKERMIRLRTSNDTHLRQVSIDVYADLKTALT